MRQRVLPTLLLVVLAVGPREPLLAQQVTTHVPFQTHGTRFFEQSNVSWSINNPHYFVSFNGGGVVPPFGGYQPNAGVNGGFAAGNARLNYSFAQGASLTSSTVAPVLTTTNGYPGSLFIGSTRPFVVGVVPIVGNAGFANAPAVSPLAQRIATGQLPLDRGRIVSPVFDGQGVPPSPQPFDVERQLAERHAAVPQPPAVVPSPATIPPSTTKTGSREASAAECFELGASAEKAGKMGLAKIYYQLAATKGDGLIRLEAEAKLAALK